MQVTILWVLVPIQRLGRAGAPLHVIALGHSSNVVAVDLCHGGGARRLALFHHEPTYTDEDIQRMHRETIRYEELVRGEAPPLEVICAYDGLEVTV